MKSTPSFDEIFAVMSAVSVGDTEARVALPTEAESNDLATDLSIALNRLLDGFHAHVSQLQDTQRELETLLAKRTVELEKSNDKFAKAFHASPAGIAIAALPEGRWLEMNDALANMTGYSREELLGKTSAEMGLVDAVARAKILQAIAEHGMVRNVEIQLCTKSQESIDVLLSVEQIEIDGQACALSIQYDITERKRLEAAVMELALERNQAMMFQRFIGGVSHDLRTPLATIKSILYLLKKSTSKQHMHYLSILESRTSQIVQIVEDMLYLSALDQELVLDLQACELGTLIENVVSQCQSAANLKNQTIRFEEKIDSRAVRADTQAVEQTVKHLLNNAINYTPSEGVISIYTHREAEEIVVAVADNGIGISPEDLPQIFERFYRVDKARSTDTGGTGIGLSICKKIVEQHGGRIWVESLLGRGSIFYFSLPLDAAR